MLQRTYDKVNALFADRGGYIETRTLLSNKITTIQIRELLEEGKIERISHGNYWNLMSGKKKPKNYKMLEACLTNPRAVICALSACYFHGLIEQEPDKLYVATARTDRARMTLTFPVSRHYFSDRFFEDSMQTAKVGGKTIRVYDVDRSVCDCIRLQDEIGEEMVVSVVERYKNYDRKRPERLLAYADKMRVGKIVRKYIVEE